MWQRLGDTAIRFARPDVGARALVRELRAWPNVVDVVVAREDIAIYVDPAFESATLDERIARLAELRDDDSPGREHVLRAIYDGPDLVEIASAVRTRTGAAFDVDDVIAAHTEREYTVAMMGFAPGFAYLDGLDPRLEVPRRANPRPRVAANSLAIAGAQTAVYPFAGPGGWHLIGRVVDVRMFDEQGPLLALGDRVRFVS